MIPKYITHLTIGTKFSTNHIIHIDKIPDTITYLVFENKHVIFNGRFTL